MVAARHERFGEDDAEMEIKRERMDEIERLSVKYDAPIVVLLTRYRG